jgi:MFS family permease
MGTVADRVHRVNVLSVSCILWSLTTLISGFATNFTGLLVPRIFLGFFESACDPPCYSLIGDYFSLSYRSRAYGIFSTGLFIGIGLSSLCLLMITSIGWRFSFITLGLVGIGWGFMVK